MARDHQVLVGWDHSDRAGAFVGTDDRVVARVPLGIEADAEMLEAGARFPAHRRGVLADPAREDEGVDPAQDRGERADVLAELMAEELDRVGRRRLTCAHGEQHLHVRADAGHAEKAGLVIDEACERRHVVAFVRQEMDEDAGIEIAAARAHHEAAARRESHRRVDGTTVTHRRHAGAVAEVRDHRAAERRCPDGRDDVLVRQAVEAVAPDTLRPEQVRERQALRHLGHAAVEGGRGVVAQLHRLLDLGHNLGQQEVGVVGRERVVLEGAVVGPAAARRVVAGVDEHANRDRHIAVVDQVVEHDRHVRGRAGDVTAPVLEDHDAGRRPVGLVLGGDVDPVVALGVGEDL